MDTAKLSFYDIFNRRRITSLSWTSLNPGETTEEKHTWLFNRHDSSPGTLATRLRVSAFGLSPAGDAVCISKYVEVRSDGVSGETELPFDDDSQDDFTPVGDSLLESGKFLPIGDIPPGCGRRLIFRLNLPPEFDSFGTAIILLAVGYRELE